jgi:hypothetical protein
MAVPDEAAFAPRTSTRVAVKFASGEAVLEAINQLEHSYFLARAASGNYRDCIDWAMDRLRRNEDQDDANVILLAVCEEPEEARTFTELVIETYSGHDTLDAQLAGGKYLVALRHEYLRRNENVHSLESKLQRLYWDLGCPGWLSVLCRNCRHARESAAWRGPFDREFAYLARLWSVATTREQFDSRYNPGISAGHDGP